MLLDAGLTASMSTQGGADDPMSPSELADIARSNRRAQAAICVIEFGRRQTPSPSNFLSQLAHESGGRYGYVNVSALK